jgi:hypothetical protein
MATIKIPNTATGADTGSEFEISNAHSGEVPGGVGISTGHSYLR